MIDPVETCVEAYKDPSKGYGCSYQDAVLKNA